MDSRTKNAYVNVPPGMFTSKTSPQGIMVASLTSPGPKQERDYVNLPAQITQQAQSNAAIRLAAASERDYVNIPAKALPQGQAVIVPTLSSPVPHATSTNHDYVNLPPKQLSAAPTPQPIIPSIPTVPTVPAIPTIRHVTPGPEPVVHVAAQQAEDSTNPFGSVHI